MKSASSPLDIQLAAPPLRRPGLRVLVVDRDPMSRHALVRSIRSDGLAEVEAFATAREALTQGGGESYDLCLIDYALDGVDGVMLGAMIRALNPGARLVLMSAAVGSPLLRRAVEHGFQTVLAKPLAPGELVRLLQPPAG